MLELNIKGKSYNFIGDPHLGKVFSNVPLLRRGEREETQFKQFSEELNSKHDITIMVGDLFDTFNVNNDVLIRTYNCLIEAASNNPNKTFILISGNHDISRNAEVKGSFSVLKLMLKGQFNVHVFMETSTYENILLCPYSEFKTAEEVITPFVGDSFDLAVGHWDTVIMSGTHNLIPLELLKKMTSIAVSGHEHLPYQFEHENLKVHGTGSMQPYSHSEDSKGELYVTHTSEQISMCLEENPNYYKDKALRALLLPDEVLNVEIDCLQFSIKRVPKIELEEEVTEASFGEFNFPVLFEETFLENGLTKEISKQYWDLYTQRSSNDS